MVDNVEFLLYWNEEKKLFILLEGREVWSNVEVDAAHPETHAMKTENLLNVTAETARAENQDGEDDYMNGVQDEETEQTNNLAPEEVSNRNDSAVEEDPINVYVKEKQGSLTSWEDYIVPWKTLPAADLEQCFIGTKDPTISTRVVYAIVSEMLFYKQYINTLKYRNIVVQLMLKFPASSTS